MYFLILFLLLPFQLAYSQECQSDYPQTTPSDRFEIHGDGSVTDKKTKLIWKRCLQGLSGENCSQGTFFKGTWEQALQEAENNPGWRLPNIKELQSIVEKQCTEPAINIQIFPGNLSAVWSSTPDVYSYFVWDVNFKYGYTSTREASHSFQVRLVRSEQ